MEDRRHEDAPGAVYQWSTHEETCEESACPLSGRVAQPTNSAAAQCYGTRHHQCRYGTVLRHKKAHYIQCYGTSRHPEG